MTSPDALLTASAFEERHLFGHPRGLWFLAFTEAWERFSYYGMQTLLVLYMVSQLLLPGHVEHVAGFAAFHAGLERVYGPLSTQALASAIFGLYTGLVYLTPIAGGALADRLLGRTRTIMLGGGLMAAGHLLMAFDISFLLALACLAAGTGCFKGNIASQVGGLYAPGDLRRADAFQIFFLAINAGVILSPLICGTLGEVYGWHYGFGAAAIGMLAGLAIYTAGRRYLPQDRPESGAARSTRAAMSRQERRRIAILLALLPALAVAVLPNQQIFNAYLVWGQANYDFMLFDMRLPTTWLITLDAVVSVGFLAGMVIFWRLYSRRFDEPDEITKMAIGASVGVIGMLVLAGAAAQAAATGGKISLLWAIAFHTINSIAFANLLPVGLALYARAAPAKLSATIIGIYYLHLFAANNLTGWIGGFLSRMSATNFWFLHAALAMASAAALFLFRGLFRHELAPTT